MSRRSLQIDNKKPAFRKSSFFDAELDECYELEVATEHVDNLTTDVACEKKDKRFRTTACIAIGILVIMLVVSAVRFGTELFTGGNDGTDNKVSTPTRYDIYTPDWETDIFELEEYKQLSPGDITYSKDGVSFKYKDGDDVENNRVVAFFKGYFDAIKKADTETLNSLFTDEYISENGNFDKFPMQKIYNIEIIVQPTTEALDEKYKNKDYGLYVVKYNIYRNDGLFCKEVDETYARIEGIVVVFDSRGNGKISQRIDAKYYYSE